MKTEELSERIIRTSVDFDEAGVAVFEHQFRHNSVYRRFCEALGVREVDTVRDIPLIPIEAFKDAVMLSDEFEQEQSDIPYFQSSGTTGMRRSRHYVPDNGIYRRSVMTGMKLFYEMNDLVILAYTPGYEDNPHSSLITMLKVLIGSDDSGLSRFLETGQPLDNGFVKHIQSQGKRIMLFGAAFGLLDLIEAGPATLPENSLVMETGGMKTYRREMSKEELHQRLAAGFGLPEQQIHSEYGMTEMLSQAYNTGDGWFRPIPWLRITIRDPKDPLKELAAGEEGRIGVMDLANIHSCSFFLTGDRGIARKDGTFQVLGRWNPVNLRGCNFLIDRD